jgi:hypothetical protein
MALWLVRAGSHGEHEHQFFHTAEICLTPRFASTGAGRSSPKTADRKE